MFLKIFVIPISIGKLNIYLYWFTFFSVFYLVCLWTHFYVNRIHKEYYEYKDPKPVVHQFKSRNLLPLHFFFYLHTFKYHNIHFYLLLRLLIFIIKKQNSLRRRWSGSGVNPFNALMLSILILQNLYLKS